MDREFLISLANREKRNRRYGQLQADLRNVVNQCINGNGCNEFYTKENVTKTSNFEFWSNFLQKIDETVFANTRQFAPLSIYELTNMVGTRAMMLSMGVMEYNPHQKPCVQQALCEIQDRSIESVVRRKLPDGTTAQSNCPRTG